MLDKKEADLIVEVRSGALSIDRVERLLGIPSFSIPIPLAGSFKFPEIALYKTVNLRVIVRFSLFAYDVKNGVLNTFSGPIYGRSHHTKGRALIYSWTDSDVEPK
ncbi:hypothetical protein [Candidatus Nitrosoglobus terrae]|uniref:hypothetical protein n=1 Tax=Candidatus Nitrosoglobus terrae TaxID=1630141 RepID=UPI000BBB0E87|nr:hypothetical protein [Candidatus Nitrosoglobus terrae]